VEARRAVARRGAAAGPLRDYLTEPFPDPGTPLADVRLLALDIETTGLDPRSDRVLSVGFVPVDGRRVDLAGAHRALVRDTGGVGRSATVHGLTDDALADGVPLEEAVGAVLRALRGRALLAHHARIETGFLDAACHRLWGAGMPCVVVDTFELERRALARGRWDRDAEPGELRLWAARERYGLPVYRAHEALTDALACAELYLAQSAALERGAPRTAPTLRHVVA
jgi:DNA polymerase-3 subunit epsilon